MKRGSGCVIFAVLACFSFFFDHCSRRQNNQRAAHLYMPSRHRFWGTRSLLLLQVEAACASEGPVTEGDGVCLWLIPAELRDGTGGLACKLNPAWLHSLGALCALSSLVNCGCFLVSSGVLVPVLLGQCIVPIPACPSLLSLVLENKPKCTPHH